MSERPGTIAAIYDVTLPRPRNLRVMGHPTFVDLTQRIRGHFYARGHLDKDHVRRPIRIVQIKTFERPMRFARPFRFGLVTVDEAPQASVQAVVEVEGIGAVATGVTAEMMMPKWFDKNPAKTPHDTIADLKASLGEAARIYVEADGWDGLRSPCARLRGAEDVGRGKGPARPRRVLRMRR